jgi:hypothetical protein
MWKLVDLISVYLPGAPGSVDRMVLKESMMMLCLGSHPDNDEWCIYLMNGRVLCIHNNVVDTHANTMI